MKILLITFDKEMENKIRQLLKDYHIVTAKNGEEALLLNLGNDVDLIIYDALAGGIAEDDINKLYNEGYREIPYIVLMDDLFPIDPSNIKPKNKKILSREVDIEKLPKIVEELVSGKGIQETQQTAEEEKIEEQKTVELSSPPTESESSWEEMFAGVSTVKPSTSEEKPAEEKKEETAVLETAPSVEAKEETKEAVTTPSPQETETQQPAPSPLEASLRKKCLVVSFDMPLVDKIKALLKDNCELFIARSAKQALQKYGDQLFDVIIFDTISGVFAEKGIKDLYSRDNFKDSLYVLLLDELFPIDIEKLPVQNLRAIKRESELELLPEIVEKAPHITLEKALFGAAEVLETATETEKEKPQEVKEETPVPIVEKKTVESTKELEKEPTVGEVALTKQPAEVQKLEPVPSTEVEKEETPKVEEVEKAPVEVSQKEVPSAAPVVQPQPAVTVQISEEQIAQIVEQKINEKVIPLIEELIKSKLSEIYIKALARELIEEQIDTATVKEIVREIAEPLVKETLESLLTE